MRTLEFELKAKEAAHVRALRESSSESTGEFFFLHLKEKRYTKTIIQKIKKKKWMEKMQMKNLNVIALLFRLLMNVVHFGTFFTSISLCFFLF